MTISSERHFMAVLERRQTEAQMERDKTIFSINTAIFVMADLPENQVRNAQLAERNLGKRFVPFIANPDPKGPTIEIAPQSLKQLRVSYPEGGHIVFDRHTFGNPIFCMLESTRLKRLKELSGYSRYSNNVFIQPNINEIAFSELLVLPEFGFVTPKSYGDGARQLFSGVPEAGK